MGTLDLQAVFQTRLKPWANFRQSCTPNLRAPGPSSPRDCTLQMAPPLKPKDSRRSVLTPASPPAHVWPGRGQSCGEVWPAGPGLGILGWLMPLEVDSCLIPGPVAGRSHLSFDALWHTVAFACPLVSTFTPDKGRYAQSVCSSASGPWHSAGGGGVSGPIQSTSCGRQDVARSGGIRGWPGTRGRALQGGGGLHLV